MAMSLYEKLKSVFGEEFARKYVESINRARMLSEEEVNKAFEEAKSKIIPMGATWTRWTDARGRVWDCMICTVPRNPPEPRATSSGSWKISLIWPENDSIRQNGFINVFVPTKKIAYDIISDEHRGSVIFIIGKLRKRSLDDGDTMYSFDLRGYKWI